MFSAETIIWPGEPGKSRERAENGPGKLPRAIREMES